MSIGVLDRPGADLDTTRLDTIGLQLQARMVIGSQAAIMTCSSVPTVSLTHIRLVVHKDITDAFAATLILREASDFVIRHRALTSSSAAIHGRCRCTLARLVEAFVSCTHLLGLDNRGLAVGVVSQLLLLLVLKLLLKLVPGITT